MEVCRNGLLRRDLGSELEASECVLADGHGEPRPRTAAMDVGEESLNDSKNIYKLAASAYNHSAGDQNVPN